MEGQTPARDVNEFENFVNIVENDAGAIQSTISVGSSVDFSDEMLKTMDISDVEVFDVPYVLACRLINMITSNTVPEDQQACIWPIICQLAFQYLTTGATASHRVFEEQHAILLEKDADGNPKWPDWRPYRTGVMSGITKVWLKTHGTEAEKSAVLEDTAKAAEKLAPVTRALEEAIYRPTESEPHPPLFAGDHLIPERWITDQGYVFLGQRLIGAYCQNFVRLLSKSVANLKNHLTKRGTVVRFIESFNQLYPSFTDPVLEMKSLPMPNDEILNQLKNAANTSTSIMTGYCLRMSRAALQNQQADLAVIRAFGGLTVEEVGVPLYTWWKKTAAKTKANEYHLITTTVGPSTTESARRLTLFSLRHHCNPAQLAKLQAMFPGEKHVGGVYWPVARLVNHSYNATMGRAGNEDLIALFMNIYAYFQSANERPLLSSGIQVPRGQLDEDTLSSEAAKIATYIITDMHKNAKISKARAASAESPAVQAIRKSRAAAMTKYAQSHPEISLTAAPTILTTGVPTNLFPGQPPVSYTGGQSYQNQPQNNQQVFPAIKPAPYFALPSAQSMAPALHVPNPAPMSIPSTSTEITAQSQPGPSTSINIATLKNDWAGIVAQQGAVQLDDEYDE